MYIYILLQCLSDPEIQVKIAAALAIGQLAEAENYKQVYLININSILIVIKL